MPHTYMAILAFLFELSSLGCSVITDVTTIGEDTSPSYLQLVSENHHRLTMLAWNSNFRM
jgi:hypothetical protein